MRNITISSYRNKTEKLAFEWPEQLPNTKKGAFNHKVVCNVINPMPGKIMQYRIKWAVDTAMHAHREDVHPTVFNDLTKLKHWLRYAPLRVNEIIEEPNNLSPLAETDEIEIEVVMYKNFDDVAIRKEKLELLEGKAKTLMSGAQEFDFAFDRYLNKVEQSKACVIL